MAATIDGDNLIAMGHSAGAHLAVLVAKQVEALFVKRCTDDKWSEKAKRCMVDQTDFNGIATCEEKLTVEQKSALDDAFSKLLNANPPPP